MKLNITGKEIDIKSLIIGFLLATVVFLTLGSGFSSSETQDVRIVDISCNDYLKVKIDGVDSYLEIPVVIKGQPVEVKTR